jgi:hypothetical protein
MALCRQSLVPAGASLFGESGSLFVRINSLFDGLGNSTERPAHFNGLATALGLQKAARTGFS